MQTLGICASLLAAGLRSELQYRANFLMMVLMGLVFQGTGFVFIWVVLARFHDLAGWNLGEVAFLYGLRLLIHALSVLVFGRIQQLDWLIRQGEFDRYLVRPLSPFLQLTTERVQVNAFGDLLGGIALFAAANSLVGVNWSPAALGFCVVAVIGGCLLESSLKLCVAALAFRFLQTGNLVFFVDQIFNNFGNYPLKIFSGTVEFLLTFAFPLAFVAYFPATVLLDRTRELSVSPVVAYLAPLVGALWFAIAYLFWQGQIAQYQSSGH